MCNLPPSLGLCSTIRCDRPVVHLPTGTCKACYNRAVRRGEWKAQGESTGPGAPNWKGSDISYSGAHDRARSHFGGPARSFHCAACDARAAEFALQPHAVAVRFNPRNGCYYSTDPEEYAPMCARCHRDLDRAVTAWSSLGLEQAPALFDLADIAATRPTGHRPPYRPYRAETADAFLITELF